MHLSNENLYPKDSLRYLLSMAFVCVGITLSFAKNFSAKSSIPIIPSLLVDVTVSNTTPSASEIFCYRVRYRCASVTNHCVDAYIEMVIPTGMQIVSLPEQVGNIAQVSTSSVMGGQLVRIDLASPMSSGLPSNELAAGSSGTLRVCATWPCADPSLPQEPAVGSTINITGPTFYATGVPPATATAPSPVTVPAFSQCPIIPNGNGGNGFVKAYNGYAPNVNPGGFVPFFITLPPHDTSVVITDSFPDGMTLSTLLVDPGWSFELSCGGDYHPIPGYTNFNLWLFHNSTTNSLDNLLIDPFGPDIPSNQTGCSADTLGIDVRFGFGYITDITGFRVITPAGGNPGVETFGMIAAVPYSVSPGDPTILNCVTSTDTSFVSTCFDEPLNVVAEPLLNLNKQATSCLGSTTIPNQFPLNTVPNFSSLTKDADDILWRLEMIMPMTNGQDISGFMLTDTLPLGLTFDAVDGNWWMMATPNNSGIPVPFDFVDQPDCMNPLFTKTFAADGREILTWDFQTCTYYHGFSNLRVLTLYLTTKFDTSFPLLGSFQNKASFYLSENRFFSCANFSGGIEPGYSCEAEATCFTQNISGGGINSSKWVTGILDTTRNRYPNIGATDTSGIGTYELIIDGADLRGIKRLEIVDILPHIGDSILISRTPRDSEWSMEMAGAPSFEKFDLVTNSWVDVSADILVELYANTYNPCYMDAIGQVKAATGLTEPSSAGCDSADFSATNSPIGAKSFAFVWESATDPLAFGEQMRITIPVKQLTGETDALNGEVAWNSFAVTATDLDDTELFSSEPLKVGLFMFDNTNVQLGNLIWFDNNANGIQDPGEVPISNVTVTLCDATGSPIVIGGTPATAITDANGNYEFSGLLPNTTYIIKLENPSDYTGSGALANQILTPNDIGTNDQTDSDAIIGVNGFPEIIATTGPVGSFEDTYDFGFYLGANLCGYTWFDIDGLGDQNSFEPPYENVTIDLLDINEVVISTTNVDASGNYAFSDILPGTYFLQATDNGNLGYVFTVQNQGTSDLDDSDADATGLIGPITITSGETICFNDIGFTVPQANAASIAGVVWDELTVDGIFDVNEFPIPNLVVDLLDSVGFVIASTTTDFNGTYMFPNLIPNNTYTVHVNIPNATTITLQDQGVDDTIDSDINQTTGISGPITPGDNENITDVDAGLLLPYSIGNCVFNDIDDDGLFGPNEGVFVGLKVWLLDAMTNTVLDSTITDSNGKYLFTNLSPNDYQVELEVPSGYRSTTDIGSTPQPNSLDQDDNGVGSFSTGTVTSSVLTIATGGGNPGDVNWGEIDHGFPINGVFDISTNPKAYYTVDFGLALIQEFYAIGNYVWLDEDGDGDQDAGESGIPGVMVELRDLSNSLIATTITDFNGGYIFDGINTGDYSVEIVTATLPPGLTNQTFDSDLILDNTSPVSIINQNNLAQDFGYNFAPPAATNNPAGDFGAIGDRIWSDANSDGVQDSSEPGIENITVNLLNASGVVVGSKITDAAGYYIFDNLPSGIYSIEVDDTTLPPNYNLIPTGDPDNDLTNDSEQIVLGPGDVYLNMDFGYNDPTAYSIGDFIFLDANANGVFDVGELPIPNVTVALVADANGNGVWDTGELPIATTQTDVAGNYLFDGIIDGNYVVVISDTQNITTGLTNSADPDGGANEYAMVVISGADDWTIDFGYTPEAQTSNLGLIGDFVFLDADGDDAYTVGESGIQNVEVELFSSSNNLIATTTTNANGNYWFGGLPADTYTVKINTNTLPASGSIPAGLTNSVDPDGGNDNESIVTIATGGIELLQDFGYKAVTPNTIAGTLWEDLNANGTLDESILNLFENVTIVLRNEVGNIVGTTTTDVAGNYSFIGLPDGLYTVDVTDDFGVLGDYWKSNGSAIGSDNNSQTDIYPVNVSGGITDVTADFGYYTVGAALGNFVWEDLSADGIQDAGEPGIAGVVVDLEIVFPDGTTLMLTDTTNANGFYSFENLLLDEDYNVGGGGVFPTYTISTTAPAGYQNTLIDNTTEGVDADDPAGVIGMPAQGQTDLSTNPDPNNESPIAFYDFGFTQISLPVTLLSFDVVEDNCSAKISWQSEDEVDFSHYILEKRNDAGNFEYLMSIPAMQAIGTKTYSFTDPFVIETAFYRLKLLNLDGTYTYSKIISVKTACEDNVTGLQLYPNPINSNQTNLNIKFTSSLEKVVWIVISDNLGKEHLRIPMDIISGENFANFDISNLIDGNYVLSILSQNRKLKSVQFVKIAD